MPSAAHFLEKRHEVLSLVCAMQKKRISIERQQIDAVMNAEGDAAVDMLQLLYSFINGPEYEWVPVFRTQDYLLLSFDNGPAALPAAGLH